VFRQVAAIAAIWIIATVAWFILGATIVTRTNTFQSSNREGVLSTWGAPQSQSAPQASFTTITGVDPKTKQPIEAVYPLTLTKTRAGADLRLEHRQKGLLWYSTYDVDFRGEYVFKNDTPGSSIDFRFSFPAQQAVYDDFRMTVNGTPVGIAGSGSVTASAVHLMRGETAVMKVAYKSHGLESWSYVFGSGVNNVRDFQLTTTTNFAAIDFPSDTLSPTAKTRTAAGWKLDWGYRNLVSGYQIGLTMPEKLQPGPLAQAITFWAPVSLLFFFFVIFMITTLREIDIHPMNYVFIACGFFAFHLLFAYLVDHLAINLAFAICSLVSIFLVVSYLRLVVNMRFAAVEAGISQFVFLVLFSYAFFFKGYTGLTITIGAIVTLFVAMQMTGRVKWNARFAKPAPATSVSRR